MDGKFEGLDGVAYARHFLSNFDEGALLGIRVKDHNRSRLYREPGFWGYCYPQNPDHRRLQDQRLRLRRGLSLSGRERAVAPEPTSAALAPA